MKLLFTLCLTLILSQNLTAEDLLWGTPFGADLYLHKTGFSIGYSNKKRQAVWVAYLLSADNLQAKQFVRKDRFKVDPAIKLFPVYPKDYSKSGFDKGHLAPAADMTYSLESMNNSFLMTNISPQIPGCNRGIWKRLESKVRSWAKKEKLLYVITGPVFSDAPSMLGKTGIPVPVAFYKVVFDLTPPHKMTAFIIPNHTTKRQLESFAVSVDTVELLTGLDFFSELDDQLENKLEQENNLKSWL